MTGRLIRSPIPRVHPPGLNTSSFATALGFAKALSATPAETTRRTLGLVAPTSTGWTFRPSQV